MPVFEKDKKIEDVKSLGKPSYINLSSTELVAFSFTPQAVCNSMLFNKEKNRILKSFMYWLLKVCIRLLLKKTNSVLVPNFAILINVEDNLNYTYTAKNNEGPHRTTNCTIILETITSTMYIS